jgi:predicted Zn finger-like uncharacterized protein
MDVRCEKCFTVYELDDSKVGEVGLTVKCQECGNLFKVRRRPDTAELIASREPNRDPVISSASPGPSLGSPGSTGGPTSPGVPAAKARSEERGWMLRSAVTQEVVRFRELTTLQQWIVERKVTRKDEISRGGESWKALGGIAELASFFHVVEQAEAVAHASQPGLAVQLSAVEEQELPDLPTEILPQGKPGPVPRPRPAAPIRRGNDDLTDGDGDTIVDPGAGARIAAGVRTFDDERPRPRRQGGGVLLGLVVIAALGAGGYTYYAVRRAKQAAPRPSTEGLELVQRGRAALLTDTDDGFREAISSLDRGLEIAGAPSPAALAARADLAEAHVTWAAYLLEDASRLESGAGPTGAQAAHTLRAEAQSHLERAHRVLEEAGSASADASAPLSRALGDLVRVEHGTIEATDHALQRAAQLGTPDAELAYAFGEQLLREGKKPEAIARLTEATQGADGGLVRAHYRLASIAHDEGRAADLARECEALTRLSPKHERARALCTPPMATPASSDLAVTPAPPDLAVAAHPTAGATAGATVGAAVEPVAKHEPPAIPNDYKSLVREADRLSENGHSKEARKLYERALELDPRGVTALTGLGYCDLDAERFMQAVDRFNSALAVDPSSGDAVLGLAESYKIRGDGPRAIEQYKRYLAAHPTGAKALMAQKNLRDLEPRNKNAEPADPNSDKPDKSDAPKTKDRALPRPPTDDPPPP